MRGRASNLPRWQIDRRTAPFAGVALSPRCARCNRLFSMARALIGDQ